MLSSSGCLSDLSHLPLLLKKTRVNRHGPRARCSRPARASQAYLWVRRTPPALVRLRTACACSSPWLDHWAKTSPFGGRCSPEIALEDLPKNCMRLTQYAWRQNAERVWGTPACAGPRSTQKQCFGHRIIQGHCLDMRFSCPVHLRAQQSQK